MKKDSNKEGNSSTHRICNRCKVQKLLNRDNFYFCKGLPYGFSYKCIDCHKEIGNKARTKEQSSQYFQNKKENKYEQLVFRRYKNTDKSKDFEFDLTIDYIKDSLQKGCFYCGFPVKGLDRIDNKKGHTIENTVPCCPECNIARNDNFSSEEMKIIGAAIKIVKLNRILK